jgi:four helix bundle protein
MGARRYQDLIAWQMGEAFKQEVFRLVLGSRRASTDLRYRDQLLAAAQSLTANIAEGFLRNSPAEFRRFLGIGLGSLGEAEGRLRDGIGLGYFAASDCQEAFRFGRRCAMACVRLKAAQLAFMPAKKTPKN